MSIGGGERFEGLVPGASLDVLLDDVAPNCIVAEPNPQTVTVVADEEVVVTFTVTCFTPGTFGSLEVAANSTCLMGQCSTPQPPDGYVLVVEAAGIRQTILANEVQLIEGVPMGEVSVRGVGCRPGETRCRRRSDLDGDRMGLHGSQRPRAAF